MPIYEYVCDKCQLKFELLKSMSHSGEDAPCPKCGSSAQRALSSFARSSDGSEPSGNGSSCSTCSADTCSSCSL
ncbi:MAG: zinc ribbon domain-containing protein [Dehalococcoidia bacterium]|nr:zinc ribbon domain-containing protein [Dehalococcoidia bacterium]TES84821.1 MAG: zinc ribbon domain-containing protein [Dehalococcoidia bacterium]